MEPHTKTEDDVTESNVTNVTMEGRVLQNFIFIVYSKGSQSREHVPQGERNWYRTGVPILGDVTGWPVFMGWEEK